MTPAEYQLERRHIYETRLAILESDREPTADQHNLAVLEADRHIINLKAQLRKDSMGELLNLRDSL